MNKKETRRLLGGIMALLVAVSFMLHPVAAIALNQEDVLPRMLYGGSEIESELFVQADALFEARYAFSADTARLQKGMTLLLPSPFVAAEDQELEALAMDGKGEAYVGSLRLQGAKAELQFDLSGVEETQMDVSFSASCIIDPSYPDALSKGETLSYNGHAIHIGDGDVQQSASPFGAPRLSPEFANAVSIEGAVLYDSANGNDPIVPIASGDTVSSSDALMLRYNFYITEQQGDAILNDLSNNTKRYVTLPNGLKLTSSDALVLEADVEGSLKKFADFVMDAGENEVYLIFTGDFWNGDYNAMTDAHIVLPCNLDMGQIQEDETYSIDIGTGTTISVKVGDNQKTAYELKKTGAFLNNRFTWTITYTPGTQEIAGGYPLTLTDLIDTDTHMYVDGSFAVGGAPQTPLLSAQGDVLSYEISTAPSGPVVISYETALTDEMYDGANHGQATQVQNKARLEDAAQNPVGKEAIATASAPADEKKWLAKTGVVNGHSIDWTIVVNINDRRLDNLKLFDKQHESLDLLESSILVNGASISTPVSESGPTNEYKTYSFDLPKSGGVYLQSYTITYTTDIDEDYFDSAEANTAFDNEAWLEFDWLYYDGSGPYKDDFRTPPSISKVPVDTSIIQKSGTYNRATHEITWVVTVNPNKVDIVSGTITDVFSDVEGAKQSYVIGSFSSGESLITETSSGAKNLTVGIGAIGRNTHSFSFKTTVDEKDFYAYNTPDGREYSNTANFTGKVSTITGDVTDSATAKVKVVSEVLKKEGAGYDYSTNTITWRATVNQNAMQMQDAVLFETLPEHLSYVEGSALINGLAPAGQQSVELTNGNRDLTITLGDIGAQTIVSYETTIDVDAYPEFKTAKLVAVANEITLKRAGDFEDLPAAGTQRVQNSLLSKDGALSTDGHSIEYAVNINPNGIDLNGAKVSDRIPDGIMLDIETLELFEASVSAAGVFTQGGAVDGGDWSWTMNAADGSFTVSLPDGPSRYILKYDCLIVDRNLGPFNNEIGMSGSSIGGDAGSSNVEVGAGGGGGGGGVAGGRKANLKITKIDSLRRGVPLEGVEFTLYTQMGGNEMAVDTQVTDANGELTFYMLSPRRDYWLVESGPIDGYGTPVVLDGGDGTALSAYGINIQTGGSTEEITITNDPILADVELLKTNDFFDHPLEGVKFEIVDLTPGSTIVRQAESDKSGGLLFEDLPYGTYSLTELETIEYHELNNTVYGLMVNADGSYTLFDDANAEIAEKQLVNVSKKGSIAVQVFDESTGNPLEDWDFSLYDVFGNLVGTQQSDPDGWLRFSGLPLGGRYTIAETLPGDGKYVETQDLVVELIPTEVTDPSSGQVSYINDLEFEWPKALRVYTPIPGIGTSPGTGVFPGGGIPQIPNACPEIPAVGGWTLPWFNYMPMTGDGLSIFWPALLAAAAMAVLLAVAGVSARKKEG